MFSLILSLFPFQCTNFYFIINICVKQNQGLNHKECYSVRTHTHTQILNKLASWDKQTRVLDTNTHTHAFAHEKKTLNIVKKKCNSTQLLKMWHQTGWKIAYHWDPMQNGWLSFFSRIWIFTWNKKQSHDRIEKWCDVLFIQEKNAPYT